MVLLIVVVNIIAERAMETIIQGVNIKSIIIMDSTLLEILEFLEPSELGRRNDIAHIINKSFRIFESKNDFEFQRDNIMAFFKSLEKEPVYFIFDKYPNNLISTYNESNIPTKWVNSPMLASLTKEGIEALKKERDRDSLLSTNESVIETNKSVQITNQAFIDSSKNQGDILNRQTIIFFFTALFALGTLILAGITLHVDSQKDTLQKQLREQSKEIQGLHNQLIQLKIDSSLSSKAKKDSTKRHGG